MKCDICNSTMAHPARLLGTKEAVTSKDCWILYLRTLIADNFVARDSLPASLPAIVGQMACSDTPWALCDTCNDHLKKAGFISRSAQNELPAQGHALCRSTEQMKIVVLDEAGLKEAMQAAAAAAAELMSRR